MLNDRNLMSHTYDSARFEQVIRNIICRYLPILQEMYLCLSEEMAQ